MASCILAASGVVVAMTSSSCMMMSEPMEFWREMECSGVRSLNIYQYGFFFVLFCFLKGEGVAYIGVPSWGLRKRTPSSVTLASFSSETIWNLLSSASPYTTKEKGEEKKEGLPPAIRQKIPIPALQPMRTTNLIKHRLPGF